MARPNRDLLVFDNESMDAPLVWTYNLNANFGFFLQFVWTALSGSTSASIYASYNGVDWSRRTLKDNKGKIVEDFPITGANGNGAIELNNFRGDYIQIRVDAATAGNLTAFMNIQENQNTY